jgi:hypothetical protein
MNFFSRTSIALVLTLIPQVSPGADISINITQPATGALISGSLVVQATVSSLFELSSVTATLENHQTNLVYSLGTWTNMFSLENLSRGPKTLTIAAQDVFGNVAQTQRVVTLDNPPVVTVKAPLNGTVARPGIYVEVSATDDDTNAGVRIYIHSPYYSTGHGLVLRGTNEVRGTILPSSHVVVEAIDSAGQKTFYKRDVLFERSTNLVETANAPGPILAIQEHRILFSERSDFVIRSAPPLPVDAWPVNAEEPRILNLSNGNVRMPSPLGTSIATSNLTSGYLTPGGALIMYTLPYFPYSWLSFWAWQETNDAAIHFASPAFQGKVVKSIAAYASPAFQGIMLHDTERTNEQQFISVSEPGGWDFASNFDLVYVMSNRLYRSRTTTSDQPLLNRTTTQLAVDFAYLPVTDGTNIVFLKGAQIFLLTPAGEELLATWPALPSGVKYASKNGWVAFARPGATGQAHIWSRSPEGVLTQRTFYSTDATLESLGPNGEVTFLFSGGRYLSLPGVSPWWINAGAGRVAWDGDKLSLILGRSVFGVLLGRLSQTRLADGQIRLDFFGPTGATYDLLTSSNLQHWSEWLSFTNLTSASWTNSTENYRFYKAVSNRR